MFGVERDMAGRLSAEFVGEAETPGDAITQILGPAVFDAHCNMIDYFNISLSARRVMGESRKVRSNYRFRDGGATKRCC